MCIQSPEQHAAAFVANAARSESELRRSQANDLINFMLGDLNSKLKSFGRQDVLSDTVDKALEYLAAADDLTDEHYWAFLLVAFGHLRSLEFDNGHAAHEWVIAHKLVTAASRNPSEISLPLLSSTASVVIK